jgi:hypothetical protein
LFNGRLANVDQIIIIIIMGDAGFTFRNIIVMDLSLMAGGDIPLVKFIAIQSNSTKKTYEATICVYVPILETSKVIFSTW